MSEVVTVPVVESPRVINAEVLTREAAENARVVGGLGDSNPLSANPFNTFPGGCYFVGGRFVNANGEAVQIDANGAPIAPMSAADAALAELEAVKQELAAAKAQLAKSAKP